MRLCLFLKGGGGGRNKFLGGEGEEEGEVDVGVVYSGCGRIGGVHVFFFCGAWEDVG